MLVSVSLWSNTVRALSRCGLWRRPACGVSHPVPDSRSVGDRRTFTREGLPGLRASPILPVPLWQARRLADSRRSHQTGDPFADVRHTLADAPATDDQISREALAPPGKDSPLRTEGIRCDRIWRVTGKCVISTVTICFGISSRPVSVQLAGFAMNPASDGLTVDSQWSRRAYQGGAVVNGY